MTGSSPVFNLCRRFIRLHRGRFEQNKSIYIEVSELLFEVHAIDMPANQPPKNWVIKHLDILAADVGAELPDISIERTKPRTVSVSSPVQKRFVTSSVAPESNEFLNTYEWRRVRMEALKKYGARCQCCGATPADGAVMNVDHIKPRKLFPRLALDLENLQILCNPCNHGKGNWDMTDWREQTA